jgi:hypothetical protein
MCQRIPKLISELCVQLLLAKTNAPSFRVLPELKQISVLYFHISESALNPAAVPAKLNAPALKLLPNTADF